MVGEPLTKFMKCYAKTVLKRANNTNLLLWWGRYNNITITFQDFIVQETGNNSRYTFFLS